MDENAEIDIEALSDEVYIPLNLLPSIVRNLNSRLAALEHEHSAADITSGTLQAARIAEGSLPGSKIEAGTVTLDRFEKSVRDSLSRSSHFQIQPGIKFINFYVSTANGKAFIDLVKEDGTTVGIQGQ